MAHSACITKASSIVLLLRLGLVSRRDVGCRQQELGHLPRNIIALSFHCASHSIVHHMALLLNIAEGAAIWISKQDAWDAFKLAKEAEGNE